jgi:hypothetical protein
MACSGTALLFKREEVTGGWRKFHEQLHNLFTLQNIKVIKPRIVRYTGHVAHMGEMRYAYKILVRKPEGKRVLWRSRHRWENEWQLMPYFSGEVPIQQNVK